MNKLISIGNNVKLRQGLAINKNSNHLISNIESEEFCIPLLRIADMMKKEFSTYISSKVPQSVLANKEDIIYTRTGQIGLVFNSFCGCVHNNSFIIELKSDLFDKEFFVVALTSEFVKKQALNKAMSSVQPDLTHDMFKQIMIPYFDKDIQKKIARLFNLIDSKIENNNKIIAELESMAKTIYNYWFLQFDFPDEKGKPYKSSGGKMVYNEELKREIPKGWEVEKIGDNIDILSGHSFKSSHYVNKGRYKLLTIKNVQDSRININVDNYINDLPPNMPSHCLLQKNDILMSLTGNVGRINILYANNCLLNQRVALLKSKENNNLYIFSLFKNDLIRKKIEAIANGSSQQNLSPIELKNIRIPYNKNIIRIFNNKYSKLLDSIVCNLAENQELASLRDFLLPMLMNGQVTFKS